MESALKKAIIKTEEQPHEILTSIREVCRQLDHVNARFEMESDSDLIEACIFEMESLRARYRYLLRIAKDLELTSTGMTPLEQLQEKSL